MSIDRRTKVLIVDDSRTVCRFLEAVFSQDPDFMVVGFALGAEEAQTKIRTLLPDVLTLDVEMPGMDGLTFLRKLMRDHPMPVFMFSSLTEVGASTALDALDIGAVDFMPKRSSADSVDVEQYFAEFRERVKAAARVRLQKRPIPSRCVQLPDLRDCKRKLTENRSEPINGFNRIVAIGASTGGPEALRLIMQTLEINDCALVISQHMPANFVSSFAQRLNKASVFDIQLAIDGERIMKGCGYLAPGDHHLELSRRADGLHWKLLSTPKVSGHRPSVNVLFDSMAKYAADQSVAVLLTGMGTMVPQGWQHFGAAVLLHLHRTKPAVWSGECQAAQSRWTQRTAYWI